MTNHVLRRELIGVVEQQLQIGDPPETRQTLKRLTAAGYPRETAIEMIASALISEIWTMLHDHKSYDRARYKSLLDALK
jgi:hypothetical protein